MDQIFHFDDDYTLKVLIFASTNFRENLFSRFERQNKFSRNVRYLHFRKIRENLFRVRSLHWFSIRNTSLFPCHLKLEYLYKIFKSFQMTHCVWLRPMPGVSPCLVFSIVSGYARCQVSAHVWFFQLCV